MLQDKQQSNGALASSKDQSSFEAKKLAIDDQIRKTIAVLEKKRRVSVFPLCLGNTTIDHGTVDDVYDKLVEKFPDGNERLEVIVDSSGGDIHAAYHLALLIRRFATKELVFIVPRWAKSAATLLVCAGNKVYMGPVSELGPVDPQITHMNPLDGRLEQFSPLHIQATLGLIRNEFEKGNPDLAKGLLARLQFPLTLGGFTRSLEIGKHYLARLLTSRMITGEGADDKAKTIAETLVEGYVDHGFCIDIDEAHRIGLIVEQIKPDHWSAVWGLHRLEKEKQDLERRKREQQMEEILKRLPPELVRSLPSPLQPDQVEALPSRSLCASILCPPGDRSRIPSEADTTALAIRVVVALLKQRGELAVQEIRAIPFVQGRRDAAAVIDYLLRHYNAEIYQKKVQSDPILRWEQFIRFRQP